MIKGFTRYDNLFSLCGLNCGLSPMQIRGDCPGRFKESHCAQTCAFAPCSIASSARNTHERITTTSISMIR